MTSPGKTPGGLLTTGLIAVVLLAAVAPLLIELSRALLPLVIVLAIAVIAVRLVFVHTRRW
ncbi:MAG TPA: hypothetical protein VF245_02465 [Solirubrobacterales bacterium]